MSRITDYCECSMPNSQVRCRISCGKPRYPQDGLIQTWGIVEYSPVYFIPDMPFFPLITEEDIERIQAKVKELVMNAQTPTILWFSKQESVGIWDAPEVLSAMEDWLKQNNETYKRVPASEEGDLEHLDISCVTGEHYDKIRGAYNSLRGLV